MEFQVQPPFGHPRSQDDKLYAPNPTGKWAPNPIPGTTPQGCVLSLTKERLEIKKKKNPKKVQDVPDLLLFIKI